MNYKEDDEFHLKNMTTLAGTVPPRRQIKYGLASGTLKSWTSMESH